MSDVYSDLNIKNGAKIVLGESGVSIDSSGCVVLDSGCTYGLSDVATRCYVDEEISKICTDGGVSGDYLQLNSTEKQNITSSVQFDGSVYLNDGGCGIIMSNCEAFVYSNATFRLPEVTSGRYTLAITDDVSGCGAEYLKLCCSTIQMVSGLVCFSCGINVNSITVGQPISLANNNCFAFYSGATFQLPNKQQCGIYTLATTEDISGSGCCYPTCYPLYSECSKLVSVFCYESSYNRAALRTCGTGIYINTEQAGDIHIDSYKNVIINAGCSIFFSNDTSAFCMFVPSHLPYMEDTIESTIVTSPGYTESGCGLQICVLTLCQY